MIPCLDIKVLASLHALLTIMGRLISRLIYVSCIEVHTACAAFGLYYDMWYHMWLSWSSKCTCSIIPFSFNHEAFESSIIKKYIVRSQLQKTKQNKAKQKQKQK
jgi:hypothetical protein